MDARELSKLAYELRKDTVEIIMNGGGGHIGGDMSVMDTLVTLYFDQMNISPDNMDDPTRDLFVMSKGHSMEAYYAVLCAKGFLDLEEVKAQFSKFGSKYIGHPNNKLPGIEMNSGSLGHGLPVCVGMALAGKMNDANYRVYTVMGDGELAEGSVWERRWQRISMSSIICVRLSTETGCNFRHTEDVMGHDDLAARFASFGGMLSTWRRK